MEGSLDEKESDLRWVGFMDEERGGSVSEGLGREESKRKKWGEGDRFGMGFRFSDKDRAALRWLAEQGTASVEQLWWAAWKSEVSSSASYADERLRKLAVGGFIKRERVYGSGRTNYIITERGMREVKESDPDRADYYPAVPRKIDVREYGHTMALNWCRIFLEKAGEGLVRHWMSDRAVRSWVSRGESRGQVLDWGREIERISPDACFEYMGKRWLLEYEGTQKNKTRYQEKALELPYRSTSAVRGVLFIAATEKLKGVLWEHFRHRECRCFTFDELKEGHVIGYLRESHALDERRGIELLEARAKEALLLRDQIAKLRQEKGELERRMVKASADIETARAACAEYGRRLFKSESRKQELLEGLKEREYEAQGVYRESTKLDQELSVALNRLGEAERMLRR